MRFRYLCISEKPLDETIMKKLNLPVQEPPKLDDWNEFINKLKNPKSKKVKVGLVEKHVEPTRCL